MGNAPSSKFQYIVFLFQCSKSIFQINVVVGLVGGHTVKF